MQGSIVDQFNLAGYGTGCWGLLLAMLIWPGSYTHGNVNDGLDLHGYQ